MTHARGSKNGLIYFIAGSYVDTVDSNDPDWDGFCGPEQDARRSEHYTKGDRQYRYAGLETLDGQTLKRYEYVPPPRSSEQRSSAEALVVRSSRQETMWVNQTGHAVRGHWTVTATRGGTVMQQTEYDVTLHGFGVPNVIEIPVVEP